MRTSASIARHTSPPTPAGCRHLRVVPPPQARRRRAARSHAPAVAALASGLVFGTLMAALVSLPFGAAGAGISLRIFVAALIVAAAALARARTVTRQTRARRMRTSRRQEAVAATAPRERLRAVA
jgi:hypothetical protein